MYNEQEKYLILLQEYGYGLLDVCDLCYKNFPIHKYNPYKEENIKNWIEFTGKQFLCQHCLN